MFRNKSRQLDAMRMYQEALMKQGAVPQQSLQAPTRPPGFVSDYVVPLMHSLTWGVIIATLGVVLYNQWGEPEASLWTIWLTYFLLVVIVAFAITSRAVWRLLWIALENKLQKDLDGSGKIGDRPIIYGRRSEPSNKGIAGSVAKHIAEDDEEDEEELDSGTVSPAQIAIDYPFRPNETTMQWFVRVSSRPEVGTSSRAWEPILGRKRYQNFRDALIGAGWARWNAYTDGGAPIVRTGWSYDKDPQEAYKAIK